MDEFIYGLLGGAVPALVMIIVYIATTAGRLARIETNICWLKKEISTSLLRLKDHTH